jgi:16S rRNA processing protein RimM
MAALDNLIQIGTISGTHGIKGEIKLMLNQFIICESDFSDSYLFIDKGLGVTVPLKVTKVYEKNSNLIIKSEELTSINEAEKFLKRKCYVKPVDFEECFSELINFKEYTVVEGDKNYGLVIDVMDNGIYELFKVNINGRNVWVPNVDRYVKSIDDDKKIITIVDGETLG